MGNNAIEVENLGKCYQIGELEDYYTLRDSLTDIIKYPYKLILNKGKNKKKSEIEFIWALKDINFKVKHGEIIGIIGRNGAGKSTLLKVLSRITTPTEGKVKINGRVGSLLEVGTGFHPELTGRENIYLNGSILGMSKKEIERKFDEIVDFAEVEKFLDTPVKRYSSGMYVRLAFAVAAHLEPEILVVDEVLSVGDISFQKKCMGKMGDVAKQGRTIFFVSHNLGTISNLCPTTILLDSGKIIAEDQTANVIEHYLKLGLVNEINTTQYENYIYKNDDKSQQDGDYYLESISIYDENNNKKSIVQTWDSLAIRISVYSKNYINSGSIILRIKSLDGVVLFLLSTEPDYHLPIELSEGLNTYECFIEKLPLSSGDYIVEVGIARPNIEVLYWSGEVAKITVHPKDVYNSGLAPSSSRCFIAAKHHWRDYR